MNSGEVRYLVIGGYAVNYHGYHRNTGDLDIWIALDPSNAERVSIVLQQFGFQPKTVPSEMFLEKGKIFRIGITPVRIELLTDPSGIEFETCFVNREVGDMDGVEVPVISLADLKVNKRASGRRKDMDDVDHLP